MSYLNVTLHERGGLMQINRMFEIIYLLLNKKTMTARELAERFEVSTRTIYRDIEILSAAGIPIYMSKGKGGGISILDDFVLNKAVLTEDEKSDILSSLKAVNAIHFNETDTALQKLGSLFGEVDPDWIEVDFSSWYTSDKEVQIFDTIKSSILSRKQISFTYASGKGETTRRNVEPLKLCFKGMARYLYAYCHLRQDFRFFKLNRIKELTVSNIHFERRILNPIFQKNDMFTEEYIVLKLRLDSEMAFRVYDEFDSYMKQPDGSFIAEITYPDNDWIFPYIASFGHHCQVLEPFDVREHIKNELQKMQNNYL